MMRQSLLKLHMLRRLFDSPTQAGSAAGRVHTDRNRTVRALALGAGSPANQGGQCQTAQLGGHMDVQCLRLRHQRRAASRNTSGSLHVR